MAGIHRKLGERYIGKSPGVATVLYQKATVKDIVAAILKADSLSAPFTARFAPMLRAGSDEKTLRNVWELVRHNVRYVRDRDGDEIVKSPGRTWADKTGDCKSMSVLVGSLLNNLGYEYYYRVAFYDKDNPQQGHIYPIAVLEDGREIVVDAVNARFDSEYQYWKKQDYTPRRSSAINGPALPPEAETPAPMRSKKWLPWLVLAAIIILAR